MKFFNNLHIDQIGFSASLICAIHCATMPIILSIISSTPLFFLSNPLFEISMIVLSIAIGFSSILPGYLKGHGKVLPLSLMLLGFSFIFSGHFIAVEELEPIVTPIGAFMVAISHFVNYKMLKCSSEISCCVNSHV
jgi:hypothetical protein